MDGENSINKICILGAGRMGASISLRCAMSGYKIRVYDINEEARLRFPELLQATGSENMARGHIDQNLFDLSVKRIEVTGDAKYAGEDTDLLIETIPEVLELKRRVLAQFEAICPPKTIFTTNTSSLLVSEIETNVRRKELFAALHFSNWHSFVDITGGAITFPSVISQLQQFCRSIKEVPIIIKKEKEGYLHNGMWRQMRTQAVVLYVEGYGTIEDIDRAEMLYHKTSGGYGPFAEMDRMGLDIVLQIAESEYQRTANPELKKIIAFLYPYVQKGELGQKTGKGFYRYPEPAYAQPDFLTA